MIRLCNNVYIYGVEIMIKVVLTSILLTLFTIVTQFVTICISVKSYFSKCPTLKVFLIFMIQNLLNGSY